MTDAISASYSVAREKGNFLVYKGISVEAADLKGHDFSRAAIAEK